MHLLRIEWNFLLILILPTWHKGCPITLSAPLCFHGKGILGLFFLGVGDGCVVHRKMVMLLFALYLYLECWVARCNSWWWGFLSTWGGTKLTSVLWLGISWLGTITQLYVSWNAFTQCRMGSILGPRGNAILSMVFSHTCIFSLKSRSSYGEDSCG
jgi:hypothetical protein